MTSFARHTRLLAGIASGAAAAIGLFGDTIWWLDTRGVRVLPPDYVLMSPVTSALLALLGGAFLARVAWPGSTRACRAGMASALLGTLVGIYAIAQYRRPIPLPWEIWLISRELVADRDLSFRMAPITAVVLIVSCLALFARSCRRGRLDRIRALTPLAAGLGFATSGLVATGYLAAPPLIEGGNVAPMAF